MTKHLSKRIIAIALTLVALMGFLPGGNPLFTTAKAYDPYDFDGDNTITGATVITAGGTYLVTGGATGNTTEGIIRVETEDEVTLILDNATFITGTSGWSPLMIGTAANGASKDDASVPEIRANVTIILAEGSENEFQCNSILTASSSRTAGIDVALGSTLTIKSEDGTPGKLSAFGGHYAAGIGSGPNKQCGTIIIESGIVQAESNQDASPNGANSGAGIGGGGANSFNGGYSEGITICGTAVVTAISYGNGAGIGGGGGGGPASVYNGMTGPGRGCTVDIYGSAVVEATSNGSGAGIGGGGGTTSSAEYGGSGGNITIYGSSSVKATSENSAGIGGGSAKTGGDGGDITVFGTPIVVAKTNSSFAAAVDIGPGISSSSNVLGAQGDITITGGNVYALQTTEVTNGTYGDTVSMRKMDSMTPGEGSSFGVIGTLGVYTYTAIADDDGETYVWLPRNGGAITITVTDEAGVPLSGASIDVEFNGTLLDSIPATDVHGEVTLSGAFGDYSITASYSEYHSTTVVTTLNTESATVRFVLAKVSSNNAGNSGGLGGSGGYTPPSAKLTIRCVDEDGNTIFSQTLSAVAGNTETIFAPPLKGYSFTQEGQHSLRITAGANEIIFRYVVDLVEMEEEDVPLQASMQRPFDDVFVSDWYDGNVTYVWEHDLMVGTDYRIFNPEMSTSRAMTITILHRFIGRPKTEVASTFTDVADDTWYSEAVAWGSENEIILGYGDGRFGPNDSITRQDLAVILARFMDYYSLELAQTRNSPEFSDADDISFYARSAISRLYRAGVINGNPNNCFNPVYLATRAEVAAIMSRFVQLIP